MKYSYFRYENGVSQYDDYNLKQQKIVSAKYVPAKVALDKGNPYIEALPYPRSENMIMRAYTKILPDYSYDKIKSLSKLDKMLQVGSLRSIRFPLPFHRTLELNFYTALLTSYRARAQIYSDAVSLEYTTNNQINSSSYVLMGDSGTATNAGFSLIGYSGCGKSSAIEILVSHYPQVIIHNDGNGGYFPQITYLVVNCVPNSNFAALYQSIGEAIDKAFGNIIPVYATEIGRAGGLGKKADKVREYIERFAIGIIIFDEIQLIDFQHTKENTFDSLLALANRTKVAIAVVGTEEAREKMFKELRTARRVGTIINGNHYCESIEFFRFLVKNLLQYQWFDKTIELTDELVDALYDETKGIVDQLIGIYSCMNYDYLDKKKRPNVNGDYVHAIAKTYYPGIQNILSALKIGSNESQLAEIRDNAELYVQELLDKVRQEQETERVLVSGQDSFSEAIALKKVISNITALYDEFSVTQIEDAYNKIMKRKSSACKSERQISRLIIESLKKEPKRKKSKSNIEPMDISQMKNFLGIKS